MPLRCTQVAIGLLLAGLVGGCNDIELKGGPGDAATGVGSAAPWPFEPVALRLHPFTAIEYDRAIGGSVLEARIELLDQVGDVTKGVGKYRFELYSVHGTGSAAAPVRERLFSWPVDVSTVEQNVRYYDAITRTYLFKLKMVPPPRSGSRLLLAVQFTDRHGKRMSAEGRLAYSLPPGVETDAADQPMAP